MMTNGEFLEKLKDNPLVFLYNNTSGWGRGCLIGYYFMWITSEGYFISFSFDRCPYNTGQTAKTLQIASRDSTVRLSDYFKFIGEE